MRVARSGSGSPLPVALQRDHAAAAVLAPSCSNRDCAALRFPGLDYPSAGCKRYQSLLSHVNHKRRYAQTCIPFLSKNAPAENWKYWCNIPFHWHFRDSTVASCNVVSYLFFVPNNMAHRHLLFWIIFPSEMHVRIIFHSRSIQLYISVVWHTYFLFHLPLMHLWTSLQEHIRIGYDLSGRLSPLLYQQLGLSKPGLASLSRCCFLRRV